ncbi:MAG: hypothetical protein MMC33_001148 [Icmadophila ericetorum]|nr:hypothetical protein [Icmadophila ericetorum]
MVEHNHPQGFSLYSPTLTHSPSHVDIGPRGLGTWLPKNTDFTYQQIHVLQLIAVTTAAVSILMALITFYWFLRMRRSYRHHLIILLIVSDGFKSLWYIVYPLVSFHSGIPPTNSTICQASGFFIALGTEASDFAILIIAVHTALYIFKTHPSVGEAGIYSHRYYAYAGWIVFPVLMASLAFVNPMEPYIGMNTFCTLPVRPFWYRLALSWIPRYIILGTITLLYIVIYLHVKLKFKAFMNDSQESFGKDTSMTSNMAIKFQTDSIQMNVVSDANLIPRPSTKLAHDGLISETPSNLGTSGKMRDSHEGRKSLKISSFPTGLPKDLVSRPKRSPVWEHYSFGGPDPIASVSTPIELPTTMKRILEHSQSDNGSDQIDSYFHFQSATTAAEPSHDVEAFRLPPSSMADISPSARRGPNSVQFSAPEDSPGTVISPLATSGGDQSGLQIINATSGSVDHILTKHRYQAIKRQLRLVFIYPLVYALLWIIPFAAHCLQYSDYYSAHPIYLLTCMNVAILCLQCAVDCIVFGIREKPWRLAEKGNGTLLDSFKFWKDNWSIKLNALNIARDRKGVGKTSGEISAEARHAKGRRDAEMRNLQTEREAAEKKRKVSLARRGGRTERSWWEVEGKRRQDSILLDTDGANGRDESAARQERSRSILPPSRRSRSRRNDTIVEEEGHEEGKERIPRTSDREKFLSIWGRKRDKETNSGVNEISSLWSKVDWGNSKETDPSPADMEKSGREVLPKDSKEPDPRMEKDLEKGE